MALKTMATMALGLGLLLCGASAVRAQGKAAPDRAVLSPDGKRLVLVDEFDGLLLWDLAQGTKTQLANGSYHKMLTFSPDGKLLVGMGEKGFQVWDAEQGKEVKLIKDMFIPVAKAKKILMGRDQFGPGKSAREYRLFVASDTSIVMFDGKTGFPYAQLIPLEGRQMLGFLSDGKTLVLGRGHPLKDGNKIVLHYLHKQEVVNLPYSLVTDVRLSPDGKQLAVDYLRFGTTEVGYTALYDLEQRRELFTMPRSRGKIVFAPDSKLAIE
jgi:WD40 repeat protein